MSSKIVPVTPVDDPHIPQQDQPYTPQQPTDQLYSPQQNENQPYPPQQPAVPLYPQQQPADQFRPPPGYQQAGFPTGAPVIVQQPTGYQQASNTTIVLNQQAVMVRARNWSSGLCGCFEDCGSLCMGLFCPQFLLLDVSSKMGEGCCLPCCCPLTAMFGLRTKLRVQHNIQGSLMDDYLSVQCCTLCVLCQLSRELKNVPR